MSSKLPTGPRARVQMVHLGCAKNRVDGEWLLGQLAARGYEVADAPDEGAEVDADVLVVNTCSFLQSSTEESIDAILDAARLKAEGRVRRVVVSGCLLPRYGEELVRELPEVDLFIGPGQIPSLAELLGDPRAQAPLAAPPAPGGPSVFDATAAAPRVSTTPAHAAYLKIAEGCSRRCAFCTIPSIRGRQRSRAVDDLVEEARALVGRGVKELTLVSHDLTSFGRDLEGRPGLATLLDGLATVEGLVWTRLLYAYPSAVDERVLERLASGPPFARYLDLPVQHASSRVLRAMRRGYDRDALERQLEGIRARVPGITLRTTLIVGHPGETDADFEELLAFLSEQRFRWVGAFPFSPEDGTPSAELEAAVPESVIEERLAALGEHQAAITESIQRAEIGREMDLLVEGLHPETELIGVGRTEAMAPEVDGTVLITDGQANAGDLVRVRIEEVQGWDQIGTIVERA